MFIGVPLETCNECIDQINPYIHCVQNEVTRVGESIEFPI